jgi:hypothetical protein
MPRLDHRVTAETAVGYETRLLVTVLLQQLNILRQAVDLPLLEWQDMQQAMHRYIQAHPYPGRGQGG